MLPTKDQNSNAHGKPFTDYFDKKAALNELQHLYAKDEKFFIKEFAKLAHFTRKFNLSFEDLNSLDESSLVSGEIFEHLFEHLESSELDKDQKMIHSLCLTLKYLTQNSTQDTDLDEVSWIARQIGTCDIPVIKNELVSLLICKFEKLKNSFDQDLEKLIVEMPEIDQKTKALLLSKLEINKVKEKCKINRSTMEVRNVKKNQQVVSKTIQTARSKQEAKQSEEAAFNLLELRGCMKNRNEIRNTVSEPLEQVENTSGSDRAWYRSPWYEAVHLYQLASQGQLLKDVDKDIYLPDKFLGKHYFPGHANEASIINRNRERKIYSFLINRMIASTFCKISRKQQLNEKAINKLLMCITDFKASVSVLKLPEDFVDVFEPSSEVRYLRLKEITSPDIVAKFVKDILDKTIEKYVPPSGLSPGKLIRKSYRRSELEEIVATEINCVRLDAINALYNCALRDKEIILTKERIEIFRKQENEQNKDCYNEKYKELIPKILELAEPLNHFNYAERFHSFLSRLNPESTDDTDLKLRFMLKQVEDLKRSQELFNDDVMEKFIRLLKPDSCFSKKQKLNVIEIINTYLEHEANKNLSEKNMKELLNYCFNSNDSELIKSGLNSLLLSTQKTQSMSQDILEMLFSQFNLQIHDEECTSRILLILSQAFCANKEEKKDDTPRKDFLDNPLFLEIVSNKIRCDHVIKLDDEDNGRVNFFTSSKEDSYMPCEQISFLSVKIIHSSVENKIILSSATIDNLLLVFESNNENDKQTKILSSKCLYIMTSYMSFKDDILNQLLDFKNNPIYDVSVYLRAAYMKECAKVAQKNKRLDNMHMEKISALFISESLKLGQKDYEEEINKDFFTTLSNEAWNQEFNDKNIFLIFDNILNYNGKYTGDVLKILLTYSRSYKIPETTVKALENLLNIPSYFKNSFSILQKVISKGQALVSSKTLNVFVDYFFYPSNNYQSNDLLYELPNIRSNLFELLEQASQNQELPQDIFFKLELARAGYALESYPGDKEMIINFIEDLTKKGMQLPINTKRALKKEINNTAVLKIFANVSKNKHIIEEKLLQDLINLFNPRTATKKDVMLIKIFENATKNNQTLPTLLLQKLELALGCEDLERYLLPVFIFLAQKGKHLSEHVINKLLDWLFTEKDPVLKQELLSSLGSLIDANKEQIGSNQNFEKLNQILAREIRSDNFNIQKLCMTAVNKLLTVSKHINEDLLEKLVEIGTHFNCNDSIRNEIRTFIQSIDNNYNPLIIQNHYREKIELANLHLEAPQNILAQLKVHVDLKDGFLPQNYKQLKNLIGNENAEQQKEVLSILKRYRYKGKITDELLDSVATLFESTTSEFLKNLCLELFNDCATNGKTLNGRAGEIWKMKFFLDENLSKFFESHLFTEFKQDFKLEDKVVIDLLLLVQTNKKVSDVETLSDLIQLIIKEESDYIESKSFVLLVEQCLIKKKILRITLPCYCRLVKERKVCRVKECLTALVEYVAINSDVIDQPRLFECMYYTSVFTELPDVCMDFVANNMCNKNKIICGYSFAILRASSKKNQKYANQLNDWCDTIRDSVNFRIAKSEDYLDLLETVVAVGFLDGKVFNEMERRVWKQELLISNLFDSFKVPLEEQLEFYPIWCDLLKNFQNYDSWKILSLINYSKFDTFSQIHELLSIILELSFEEVIQMLTIHGPEPYDAFKQGWCMQKMQACFPNSISSKYCNKLARKICSSFCIDFIRKLFNCLKSIDNLSKFENIIELCSQDAIAIDLKGLQNVQLNHLKLFVEAKHLCKRFEIELNELEWKYFLQIYENLYKVGWNFDHLCELLAAFNPNTSSSRFQDLINLLNMIHVYHLSSSSNFDKCKEIFAYSKSSGEMIRKLNQLAIKNYFQLEGKVKDLNELLIELEETNTSETSLVDFIQKGSVNIKELIFTKESEKLNLNEKQIFSWAKDIKSNRKEFSDYEALAIILRANYLATGRTLTEIQILCSLIALRSCEATIKGKLLQVATGEGKSTIISILAIINALRGKHVDVITSSPVLAERDAKQEAKLYSMFDLSCSDNNDKTIYVTGKKDCYSSDIVYGEMSQFQFDILRDNYSKLGTLGDRKFATAIVDEVDSMLIDDSSKIARLSSTVPGMDHFQAAYVFIWQHLNSIKEKLIVYQDQVYFINGKLGFENGKTTLEFADTNDDILKIPDLEGYLFDTNDISQIGRVVDDVEYYLKTSLESYLDCLIKENIFYIPSNFMEFVKKQKSKWITNAIEALNYQENVHYIIQEGEIKPVDYYSTGIVQKNTNWSDGLHQFLQLKHNLKITSETLTTNFLSNIGFIKKYEQVYGLTGTLGSETARNVLKDVYEVELINIPQRRQKQFLELESNVAQGEANWLNEITSNIKLEVQKQRGVLVICETIEHANRISEILKNTPRLNKIKLYTMNDMNQEKNVEKISPCEVIIATNLAGRGTDIQTDEIEESGGLHVILTFLPRNQRVEDQAFGRTARQGKRGTGIMILNSNNLDGNTTTTKNIKIGRDEMESRQLTEFKEKELKLIQVKDSLFSTFCSFLNDDLRIKIRKEHNSYVMQAKSWINESVKIDSAVISWFTDVSPTTYEICVLAAVEEQWAGFLSKLDEGTIKCEDAETECKELISKLNNDFESETLIKNPYYYIVIANDILMNYFPQIDCLKKAVNHKEPPKVKQALNYFEKAITLAKVDRQTADGSELDAASGKNSENLNLIGAAHMGVAWCSILLKEENYKGNALSSFETALKCLSNEMSILNAIQILLEQKQQGFVNSGLYKQLNAKATILGSYLNGVHGCIDVINRSKRLVDIVAVRKQNENGILEVIKHFNGQERDKEETSAFMNTDLKLKSDESYTLTFNHLTKRKDFVTIDQALITIKNSTGLLGESYSNIEDWGTIDQALITIKNSIGLLGESYSDIRISMKKVNLERVNNALFNPNKEFKELTGKCALMKLEKEQSYRQKFGFTKSFETSLSISSNGEIKQIYEKRQINELIKILKEKDLEDDALSFDIIMKNANENEINKLFKSGNDNNRPVKLNVVFSDLEQEAAKAKVSSIKARLVDVEFVLDKSNLLQLIRTDQTLKSCKLYISEQQHFEKVDGEELLKRVNELEMDETPCFVCFEQLTIDQAKNIITKECHQNVLFNISFIDVFDFYNSKFNDGEVNYIFDQLNHKTAKLVINVLRNHNFEFSLEFRNLSDTQARFVLTNANLEQEDIEIREKKKLSDLYLKTSIPTFELNEFASKGIELIIEINEKLFIPWRSVSVVAAIGSAQIIGGVVMICTGFGASFGMSFVTEGIADIITAYRAYSSRQFHWNDYCKQKAISLAISATSMGFSKMKDAFKGVETITTATRKELLEQAGTQIIANRQAVSRTMISTGKNLKTLSLKYVCIKTVEAAKIEFLNTGIKYISERSLDFLKPKINDQVQSELRSVFCKTEIFGYLRKMQAIDLATDSHQLQSRIEQTILEMFSQLQSEPQFEGNAKQLSELISSQGSNLLNNLNLDPLVSAKNFTVKLSEILNTGKQVLDMMKNAENTIAEKLNLINRNSMTVSLVFHKYLKIKKDDAQVIADKFKELGIFDDSGNFQVSQNDINDDYTELKVKIDNLSTAAFADFDDKNDSFKEEVSKCINFVEVLFQKFIGIDLDSFSMIIKEVSDQIVDKILKIIDSKLMEPLSTWATKTVDSGFERFERYLVSENQNSESQKADQKKYEELSQKEELTSEEKEFMDSYGKSRNTIEEQIKYNSKDYCIAYSQCEMAYYADKNKSRGNSPQDVKKIASDVRQGEPVNLAVMIAASKEHGVNLKIVDDKNYVKTQEDIDNDVEVIYIKGSLNNQAGHVYYMDRNDQFVEAKGTKNNCFFTAFSSILERKGISKSVDVLRKEIAQQIESNSENFAKVLSAEKWIRDNHSASSNNLLFTAGSYEVKRTANNVRRGEPANLAVMIAASKKNGVNLKIVDDKSYIKTQEDIMKNADVVYFEGGLNSSIGHVYYMDNNDQFVRTTETGNDRFFDAFSSILKTKGVAKSVKDLRNETAKQIESTSEYFEKLLSAEKWVRNMHPDTSNILTFRK